MVGKSTLIHYYVRESILLDYDATIEDSYRKHILINGRKHFLDILDTSGMDEYSCLQEQQITSANGFILIYNPSNLESFKAIPSYYEKIYETKNAYWVPIVLISNIKKDEKRIVSTQEGIELGLSYQMPFFEIDLKDTSMGFVEEIFDTLANLMKTREIVYNDEINFVRNLSTNEQ